MCIFQTLPMIDFAPFVGYDPSSPCFALEYKILAQGVSS